MKGNAKGPRLDDYSVEEELHRMDYYEDTDVEDPEFEGYKVV